MTHAQYHRYRQSEAEPRWRRALELRRQGLKFREIGEALGVNTARASQLVLKAESLALAVMAPPERFPSS